MDDNLTVRFTADLSAFNGRMSEATASFNTASTAIRAGASTTVGAYDSMITKLSASQSMIGRLNAFAAQSAEQAATQTASAVGSIGAAVEATGRKMAVHGAGIGFYARELHAMVDETLSGRFNQLQGTVANVFFTFAQSNPILGVAAAGFLSIAGTLAYLAIQSSKTKAAIEQMSTTLKFSGISNVTKEEVAKVEAEMAKLRGWFTGASWEDTEKLEVAFAHMQNTSKEVIQAMVADLQLFQKGLGESTADAGAKLVAMFSDPLNGIKKLEDAVGTLLPAERAMVEEAVKSGSVTKAQAAFQEILVSHFKNSIVVSREKIETQIRERKAQRDSYEGNVEAVVAINNVIRALEEQKAKLDASIPSLNAHADAMRAAGDTASQMAKALETTISANDPAGERLKTLRTQAGQLSEAMQSTTGDTAAFIKKWEGFKPNAYMDKSPGNPSLDHYAVGYGQHTLDGQEVTADTTATREQAEADLAAKITQIQAVLEGRIGESWQGISERAKTALTSMGYNYGAHSASLNAAISAASRGDEAGIAEAIRARQNDNQGVNYNRRNAEADEIERVARAAAAVKDEELQINQARTGGTEIEKAHVATLERVLSGQRDEVANQEALVKATQKQLDETSSVEARAKLEKQLLQEKVALEEKVFAVKKASASLAVGRASEGTSAEKRDAGVAAAELEMSRYAKDTAAYKAALGQKEAALRTYNASVQRDDAAAENAAYQNQINELQRQKQVNQENLQDNKITKQQALSIDLTIESQRLAIERQHLEKLKEIWGEGTAEYRAAQQKLLQVDTESSARRAAIERTANKDIAADYKSAFAAIGSSLSSSIMGMIQGTQRFADLMRNVALSIVQQFVNAGIRIVVNWAATMAQNVIETLTGEAGKTGAVAAGVATRTGVQAAGAATGAALEKASSMTTITGSAYKAGAGAYSAVAGIPIVGPILAPVAAATAFAATMAFGVFDTGAWELPQDQLAMVHKGEMIVPSRGGIADEFRNTLGGKSGPGGARGEQPGGDTHNHSWNISATDAPSFVRMLKDHSSVMAEAVSRAMDGNPKLRPQY